MTELGKMMLAEVGLPISGIYNCLTYKLLNVKNTKCVQNFIGRRVRVMLKNRPIIGVIVDIKHSKFASDLTNLKDIESVLDEKPVITKAQINLCKFVADYYMSPIGKVIRLCLPPGTPIILSKNELPKRKKISILIDNVKKIPATQLNEEQKRIIKIINSDLIKFKAFLLEGITGSGKTEIYIQMSKEILSQGKKVLIIIPEIALTLYLQERFRSQIDEQLAILHSGLPSAQRREIFHNLLENRISIVIGTRSALFAPISDLGLIIVDEEHDSSFKQDEAPRYHARDVALWRARYENAIIILGSATPSLESVANVARGKLKHLKLTKRAFKNSFLPNINFIDLKSKKYSSIQGNKNYPDEIKNISVLSLPLRKAIKETLERKEQVLLFLNRRGYASVVVCATCGKLAECPNCSSSLTFHSYQKKICCHLCNYTNSIRTYCFFCKNGIMKYLGFGTERIQEEISLLFPEVNSIRIDRDTMTNLQNIKNIFAQINSGTAQILIGTQMMAKGYDFPNLSLVGVILADIGLSIPDFRASEKTFQLLTQVSGRVGRRDRPGKVLIQTMNPENPIFLSIRNNNLNQFYEDELNNRRKMKQPPYVKSALIRIESKDPILVKKNSAKVKQMLQLNLTQESSLLGPAPALIEKLKKNYRWQIFLKTPTNQSRNDILKPLLSLTLKNTKIVIDIDPVQLT